MEISVKQQIVEMTRSKMNAQGLSTNRASQVIGVSVATLSNMLNTKWDNISDEMWRTVQGWSGHKKGWQMSETNNVRRVHNICTDAQFNGKSIAISDEPGSGKSGALKWYSSTNANVFYVECEEYWTKKILLQKILQAMGKDFEGSVGEMVEKIIVLLKSMESPLLILDEADKLKDASLQLFKTFYNKTDGLVGFVLSGAPYFRENITKGCNKNKQSYKEIYSRLGGEMLYLRSLTETDIVTIATDNGVHADGVSTIIERVGKTKDLRVVKRVVEKFLLENKVSINHKN